MWHLYDNLAIKYASKDAFPFQTCRYGTFTKQLPAFYRFTFWLEWKNVICNVWVGDACSSTSPHQLSSISQHTTDLPCKYLVGSSRWEPHFLLFENGDTWSWLLEKIAWFQRCSCNPAGRPSVQNKLPPASLDEQEEHQLRHWKSGYGLYVLTEKSPVA